MFLCLSVSNSLPLSLKAINMSSGEDLKKNHYKDKDRGSEISPVLFCVVRDYFERGMFAIT